jgi:Tfp pilus assembly protein PilN
MLTLDKKVAALDNIQELKKHISTDLPISLAINGKGVLHKKIPADKTGNEQEVMAEILPNAVADDFYLQHYPAQDFTFVSLIRRTGLRAILEEFYQQGYFVVEVGLGPYSVCQVLPSIQAPMDDQLSFGWYSLGLKNNVLTEYQFHKQENPPKELLLGGLPLDERLLVAYATAFQTLFPYVGQVALPVDEVTEQKKEFSQKGVFTLFKFSLLIACFSLLTVNFILFYAFSDTHTKLVAKESQMKGIMAQVDSLQQYIATRQTFLSHTGWMQSPRVSLYADRIAASVPGSVQLTALSVYPLDEKTFKASKKRVFEKNLIQVSGSCTKATDLNPWIKELQAFNWVKQAAIKQYTFDEKNENGSFSISIQIR